jgi:hypothetical protein
MNLIISAIIIAAAACTAAIPAYARAKHGRSGGHRHMSSHTGKGGFGHFGGNGVRL